MVPDTHTDSQTIHTNRQALILRDMIPDTHTDSQTIHTNRQTLIMTDMIPDTHTPSPQILMRRIYQSAEADAEKNDQGDRSKINYGHQGVVACRRGGVSNKPPGQRQDTGPGILWSVHRWTRPTAEPPTCGTNKGSTGFYCVRRRTQTKLTLNRPGIHQGPMVKPVAIFSSSWLHDSEQACTCSDM